MKSSRRVELQASLRDQLEDANLSSRPDRAAWISRRLVEYAWRLQSAAESEVFSVRGLVHGDPGTMVQIAIQQLRDELDVERVSGEVADTWAGLLSQHEKLMTELDRKQVSSFVQLAERLAARLEAEPTTS